MKIIWKLFIATFVLLGSFASQAREVVVGGNRFDIAPRKEAAVGEVATLSAQAIPSQYAGIATFYGPEDPSVDKIRVPATVEVDGSTYLVNNVATSSSSVYSYYIEDSPEEIYFVVPIPTTVTDLYVGRPLSPNNKQPFKDLKLKKLGIGQYVDELTDEYDFNCSNFETLYVCESSTPLVVVSSVSQDLSAAKNACLLRDIVRANPDDFGFKYHIFTNLEIGGGFTGVPDPTLCIFNCTNLLIDNTYDYCEKVRPNVEYISSHSECNMYLTNQRPYEEWDCSGKLSNYAYPLTEINLSYSYASVPDYAFFYARDLETVYTTDNYKGEYFGAFAFGNFSGFVNLTVSKTIEEIGDKAIFKVPDLKKITIVPSEKPLKLVCSNFSFGKPTVDCITLGRTIEPIQGNWAYPSPFYMMNVKKIELQEGVVDIPDYLFYGALVPGAMYPLKIPNSVETIGQEAFRTTMINKLTFGTGVKSIGSLAFADLDRESLSSINIYAAEPPAMPKDVFLTPGLVLGDLQYQIYNEVPLHVPENCLEAYKADPAWGQFKNIINDLYITPKFYFWKDKVSVAFSAPSFTLQLENDSPASPRFSSENPEVASVDPVTGEITPHKPGVTVITAVIEPSGAYRGAEDSCEVTVRDLIPVTSISVTPSEVDCHVGDIVKLQCSTEPSDAENRANLTWRVSDPSLAVIKESSFFDCKVECLGVGEFYVIADCDGVTTSVPFHCTSLTEYTIELEPTELTLLPNEKVHLISLVTPNDGYSPQIVWSSTNPAVATVNDNGDVTGIAVGTTIISAAIGSSIATCKVTVEDATTVVIDNVVYDIDLDSNTASVIKSNEATGDVVLLTEIERSGSAYPVTSLDSHAFYGTSITSLTIPASVMAIGASALGDCPLLEKVVIEDSQSVLEGDSYLYYAEGRHDYFYLGRNLSENAADSWLFRSAFPHTVIGGYATQIPFLYGSTELETVVITAPATSIRTMCFAECHALTEVTLPKELETLGIQVFYNSPSIRKVTVNAPVPPVFERDYSQFEPEVLAQATLYVPKGSSALYAQAPVWKEFVHIQEFDGPVTVDSIDLGADNVSVYDLEGRPVLINVPADKLHTLSPGVYVICQGSTTTKYVVK